MTAQFATIVAAQHRIDEGKPVVEPDLSLGHADNYLYMLNGERADDDSIRTLDTAMNLYAEHEANASTFATRVVVGTNSDLHSAIVAGIGALKGPAHGGAADDSIALIQEIGNVENVKPWVDKAFAERRLIPGFGHRVYKTGDARTPHLRNMCRTLAARSTTKDSSWVDIALATEDYVRSMKRLVANVDLYAAAALFYLDFPLNLFTNFVASARIVGWSRQRDGAVREEPDHPPAHAVRRPARAEVRAAGPALMPEGASARLTTYMAPLPQAAWRAGSDVTPPSRDGRGSRVARSARCHR